ncbi:MAG: adenosine deaminase [Anaerolineales bacterium]|nr:adenosine deaminase [Anaerolineales bacterium]
MNHSQLLEFARRMPKVELHVHLEGSILPQTLLLLAERNHVALPFNDLQSLGEFYRFTDFDHFIKVYITITSCLRTPEDYTLIAYAFGQECARQNIRYAEVTFTIKTNMRISGLPWQVILEALNAGRKRAKEEFGVNWQWVFDIVRNNPEEQDEVSDIAIQAREQGVIALGLGGAEAEYPPHMFTASFERARHAGLHSLPHAGETAGPTSIWESLDLLHAERLGHGVRCIEDPRLVEVLRQRQIPLEVCPTSNIRLGVYPDYTQHPLRRLWDADLLITVNSDDPPMFGTDLNNEYCILVERFNFSATELEQISLNALHASCLPQAEKDALTAAFIQDFAALRQELQ